MISFSIRHEPYQRPLYFCIFLLHYYSLQIGTWSKLDGIIIENKAQPTGTPPARKNNTRIVTTILVRLIWSLVAFHSHPAPNLKAYLKVISCHQLLVVLYLGYIWKVFSFLAHLRIFFNFLLPFIEIHVDLL